MTTDWQTRPMSAVMAEFYDGPHATPPPAEDGPIFLGIKNMTEDGHLDLSEVRHISESDYVTWTRRVEPRPGDIVFTYEASLHRYAILPEGFRGCLGRRVALLRPNADIADTNYLLYAFTGPEWRRTVQARLNIGATVDRLPLGDLPNFPIRLPPLGVQRKVASILSAYDDLIENNHRRIKLLEEMAQRIYREWFVEFRYPGHEGAGVESSDLGPVPSGWSVARLADLVQTQYGYTASTSELPVGPKFLRGMDINKASFIDWSAVPYCSIDGTDSARYGLRRGDILVIRMADPGKVAIVEEDVDAVFASYLIRVTPTDERILPYYLFFFLASDRYQAFVAGASTGTTRKSLSAPGITAVDLVVPPPSVQQRFYEVVRPVRGQMARLLAANNVLRKTRDLLLPRLISGQIDVEDLDISTQRVAA